ncbi:MAG: hypothetical protein ACRDRE_23065 [Pseudonocardiaceae bacterium]
MNASTTSRPADAPATVQQLAAAMAALDVYTGSNTMAEHAEAFGPARCRAERLPVPVGQRAARRGADRGDPVGHDRRADERGLPPAVCHRRGRR